MNDTKHPGDAEARAAVIGMTETYGVAQSRGARWIGRQLIPIYAVGDWVSFTDQQGETRAGRVVEVDDLGLALVHCSDGRLVATSTESFAPF